MNELSNTLPDASADSSAAPPSGRRSWRLLLIVVVVVGLAGAGFYAYRARVPKLPEIPQVNLADADPEVAAAVEKARGELQASPRSALAWGNFAMLLHANGFDEAADVGYQAAELLDPRNPDWPYLDGYLHHNGPGGPEKALPGFERAARLSNRDSMARVRFADMLLALGEMDRAEEEYRQILAFKPGEPHAQFGLARLAIARSRWEESLRYLSAIADDPFVRSRACAVSANVYQQLGDVASAEKERQRLGTLPEDGMRPEDPVQEVIKREISVRAYLAKAQVLQKEKRNKQVVAVMRDAVKKYPQSDFAWSGLASALIAFGDPEGAEKALKRSIELAPKTAEYRLTLGKLLTGQRRFDEALAELHTAISLTPRDGMVHLALGECLLEKGDHAAAAESFEAVLRYIPEQPAARRYLRELKPPAPE